VSSPKTRAILKSVLVIVVMGIVLGLAGRSVAASVPLATWLFWCGLGLLAFLAVSVVWIFFNLQLGQGALRRGGTDPQWFWFNSEPPGLAALRKEQHSSHEPGGSQRGL
jgi:hypothetical protein